MRQVLKESGLCLCLSTCRSSYEAHRNFKSQDGADPKEIWAVHGSDDTSLTNIAEYGFNRSYKGKNACTYGLSAPLWRPCVMCIVRAQVVVHPLSSAVEALHCVLVCVCVCV